MRENKLGWYASPATKSAGRPKYRWDDLTVSPYLNDDEIAPMGGFNENSDF